MKVLIVEDDFASRELLKIFVEKEKHECKTADSGELGLTLFKQYNPDVIISDVRMAGMSGIDLLKAIRSDAKDVIIIIVTGHGNEELALEALENGANNYIKKPIDLADLRQLLRRFKSLLELKEVTEALKRNITDRQISLEVPTDTQIVPSLVKFLVEKTNNMFDESELVHLELGLSELLVNSIEHGNLDITREDKAESLQKNTFQSLIAERMANEQYKMRKIHISFRSNVQECEWLIQDEGAGFDFNNIADPTSERFLHELHGRGIFLSKLQFDDFQYLDKGNVVRVKKKVKQL